MMSSTRDGIARFIGLAAPAEPPAIRVVERRVSEDVAHSLVRYAVPDGDEVEAFVCEPAAEPAVGRVLVLHQHNSQWGIGKSEVAGIAGDPLQAFGPALAKRGVTVLAPDAVGFESRAARPGAGAAMAPPPKRAGDSAEGWLQYYNQMAHRLLQGDLLMRKMLQDAMTAVTVLQTLAPGSGPVGVSGHSMGGGIAHFLTALDTRLAFTCSSGAVGSYRYKLANGIGIEMAHVIPGFVRHFDIDDLLRCVAPRRLLVVSSDGDAATADATQLVDAARGTFADLGCPDHLMHARFSGAHPLDRQRFDTIVDWVGSQFGSR